MKGATKLAMLCGMMVAASAASTHMTPGSNMSGWAWGVSVRVHFGQFAAAKAAEAVGEGPLPRVPVDWIGLH